jgi:hypothetical protein
VRQDGVFGSEGHSDQVKPGDRQVHSRGTSAR